MCLLFRLIANPNLDSLLGHHCNGRHPDRRHSDCPTYVDYLDPPNELCEETYYLLRIRFQTDVSIGPLKFLFLQLTDIIE
jgi:hypothetical protein